MALTGHSANPTSTHITFFFLVAHIVTGGKHPHVDKHVDKLNVKKNLDSPGCSRFTCGAFYIDKYAGLLAWSVHITQNNYWKLANDSGQFVFTSRCENKQSCQTDTHTHTYRLKGQHSCDPWPLRS